MGKITNIVTVDVILGKPNNHISVEPHLDETLIQPNGVFQRAITAAGLWDYVTTKSTKVLTRTVAEFLLNLREGELTSRITDPSTWLPVYVSLLEVAGIFNLPTDGETSLSSVGLEIEDEYRRYSVNDDVVWSSRGNNIREDLQKPFNFIGKLYTKTIAYYIGWLGQITDSKIFAISAIVDSLSGFKFNWNNWFIQLIQEAAKDFERDAKNPDKIVKKGIAFSGSFHLLWRSFSPTEHG